MFRRILSIIKDFLTDELVIMILIASVIDGITRGLDRAIALRTFERINADRQTWLIRFLFTILFIAYILSDPFLLHANLWYGVLCGVLAAIFLGI